MIKKILKNRAGAAMMMSLIVGIAIMVLLINLSLPYLSKFQTNLVLNGAAKTLTSDLRLAQQSTVTEQVVYAIQFNTVFNNYSLLKIDTSTTTVKTVALPPGVTYQSVSPVLNNLVSFNSFGAVSQSGQIILKNNSNTATINVKPSGYVELAQ